MTAISFGARLGQLARGRGHERALIVVSRNGEETPYTWDELDRWTNRLARLLVARGAAAGRRIVIGYPNSAEHVAATWAGWKAGLTVVPVSATTARPERDAMIGIAEPALVLADWDDIGDVDRSAAAAAEFEESPLPDVVSNPGRAVASGGSTGQPKLIVEPGRWEQDPASPLGVLGRAVGFGDVQRHLVPGPLFHNMPFVWCNLGLFAGQVVILMEAFDAGLLVDLVERHGVEFVTMVPTMMRRVVGLPDIARRDLSSLKTMLHSAAPCPPRG